MILHLTLRDFKEQGVTNATEKGKFLDFQAN